MEKYNIVRFYQRGGKRIIKRGVFLSEAQAHCKRPDTSSTYETARTRRITDRMGPWFDGYTKA